MKAGLVNQFQEAVQRGARQLVRLPHEIAECLPHDQFQPEQADTHSDQLAQLKQFARQQQVSRDQAFFREHRAALQGGGNWAGRDRAGQLHLLPHSSKTADMMMAIDRSTRVENAPGQYLLGELEGGGQAVRSAVGGVVGLASAVRHPARTLDNLNKNHAGAALVNFSRNSEQITRQVAGESYRGFCEAQHNPREGGRATGNVGGNLLLAALPLPVPSRLFRFKGIGRAAELAEHAPKTPPNPGPFPMKIWRYHPNHTRPTGSIGGKPGGVMEALEPKNPRKLRAQLRQAEAADLMADQAWRIDHHPQSNAPGVRNPDFQLEGRPVDHYSPTAPGVEEVHTGIVNKVVKKKQVTRVIVNLDDCPVTVQDLQKELLRNPIDGLEEVITIRAGEIENIYP